MIAREPTPAEEPIPRIQLAPMEGVLDPLLREMLAEVGGIDRMVTEFVRVTDRLLPEHVFRRYCPELATGGRTSSGVPVFVQLLGGKPEWLAENASRAVALGAPGIDLNFGCPAKTVNRHDGGAALLQQPRRLFDVLRAVRAAVPPQVPVTAKVRLGFMDKSLCREIAQAVEEGGAKHIVVHARTKLEMYTPPAHWDFIPIMREGRALPFLANGDIWSVEDYRRCVLVTGCARVALGRGLVRRPWLARELRGEAWAFSPVEFLGRFFERNVAGGGPAFAVARMKQLLRYWAADVAAGAGTAAGAAAGAAAAAADAMSAAPVSPTAPADNPAAMWFNRAKVLRDVGGARDLLRELAKESSWKTSKSILGPTAPTASAPRIC